MTFDDRLRDALSRQEMAVPNRSGDFERVVVRGKRRRAAGFAVMSVVAVAFVLGSVGLAAALLTSGEGEVVADRTVPPATSIPSLGATTTTMPAVATTFAPATTVAPMPTTAPTTTASGPPSCDLLATGSPEELALTADLEAWLLETRPELADSGGRVALSGRASTYASWSVVPARFTRVIFEPTMFIRSPGGDWFDVWSGTADAAELIRVQVADTVPDLPSALLDCADVFPFLEPAQATVLDADLVDRASLGRDITAGGGFVWVSTGIIMEPGVETAEVLQIDASTGLLVNAIDVTQPMSHLDYAAGHVWMVRIGDGALPDNLAGTINAATGEVRLRTIGEFSTVAIQADDTGMWLAQGNEWDPALMRIDRNLDIVSRVDVAVGHVIRDMVVVDGVAWLALDDGSVARVDPVTGDLLGLTGLETSLVAIDVGADRGDPAGRAIWVVSFDGLVGVLSSDGNLHTSYQTGVETCCVIANEASETVWLVGWDGILYVAGLDLPPTQTFVADGTEVFAAVDLGTSLWTLGDSLTWILLGQ